MITSHLFICYQVDYYKSQNNWSKNNWQQLNAKGCNVIMRKDKGVCKNWNSNENLIRI